MWLMNWNACCLRAIKKVQHQKQCTLRIATAASANPPLDIQCIKLQYILQNYDRQPTWIFIINGGTIFIGERKASLQKIDNFMQYKVHISILSKWQNVISGFIKIGIISHNHRCVPSSCKIVPRLSSSKSQIDVS